MTNLRSPFRIACWGLLAFLLLLVWAGCGGSDGGGEVSVNLTAAPEDARLQWTSKNATTVVSSNFNATALSGTKDIYPTETTVYTITVSNGTTEATDSVMVTLPNDQPPSPQPGGSGEPFAVHTNNYFYLYTTQQGLPFPSNYQLSDSRYPASCSYQSIADPPSGFELKTDSESSILVLAEADPRIGIISGVDPGVARIKVSLVETISYDGQTNIIGLTQVRLVDGIPFYDVSVVTVDPAGGMMPAWEIKRVLVHEFGHVFGLGHAPDSRDLMYYQSNSNQGSTPATFLTLGDATAQWTTLNARSIVWHPERPTITQGGGGTMIRRDLQFRHKRVNPEDGPVLCVTSR
ncbi:MAG: matrixin family metalloprotease [Armatimonadota bacterium]